MTHRIVTVTDRPDLAPTVARWRVEAFFDYPGGYTVEDMTTRILAPPVGPKVTYVLLEDDRPVGTAGLVRADLDSRPDLTPWLAGVYVEPAFRHYGYASAPVREVEAFALAAAVSTLWLYTPSSETLYARLGWQRVGLEHDGHQNVVLMRRDLAGQSASPGARSVSDNACNPPSNSSANAAVTSRCRATRDSPVNASLTRSTE